LLFELRLLRLSDDDVDDCDEDCALTGLVEDDDNDCAEEEGAIFPLPPAEVDTGPF
jgi:hypothetical protein